MEPREESPDQSEKLKQSIYVLKTHSRSVFLASLLTAIAGIMVISLIPDKYEASTTILVDPQKIPERYVASTITSDPNAHLNTLTQQVLSASRLQEIVDHLNPYPDLQKKMSREELLDFIRSKIEIEACRIGANVKQLQHFLYRPESVAGCADRQQTGGELY